MTNTSGARLLSGLADLVTRLRALEAVGVFTTDPEDAKTCCGMERDSAGRCQNRPHHPIYLPLSHKETRYTYAPTESGLYATDAVLAALTQPTVREVADIIQSRAVWEGREGECVTAADRDTEAYWHCVEAAQQIVALYPGPTRAEVAQ